MTNFESCLEKKGKRKNSVAVIGGLFGDEGKGRITDELANYFLKKHDHVIVYRDNGGSNAGHTVSVGDKKIDLHQIGSGVLHENSTMVMGKGMVIHPVDLIREIEEVKTAYGFKKLPADLKIDEMAVLCLDTHRAMEGVMKEDGTGGFGSKASTGRGIAIGYADVLFRFPLRVRDLMAEDWKKRFEGHYKRYEHWVSGFGQKLSDITVKRFREDDTPVGDFDTFIKNIDKVRDEMLQYCEPVYDFMKEYWEGDTPFVFEKAQGVGLDSRWCVYPDSTASDCCLSGITFSTEGVVNADDISGRIGVIKSTYTSSVGKRVLPTPMEEEYAKVIREDANEYGATTGRPRDIVYMDNVMLKYFIDVGGIDELAFTHMDIVYDRPVKLCIGYKQGEKDVRYRPDQLYLDTVKPVYKKFPQWDGTSFEKVNKYEDIQKEAKDFIEYVSKETETTPVLVTYGPNREQTILV